MVFELKKNNNNNFILLVRYSKFLCCSQNFRVNYSCETQMSGPPGPVYADKLGWAQRQEGSVTAPQTRGLTPLLPLGDLPWGGVKGGQGHTEWGAPPDLMSSQALLHRRHLEEGPMRVLEDRQDGREQPGCLRTSSIPTVCAGLSTCL